MPNYFKLDSNVDLTYTDANGDQQLVKDAIQVVSGTDGSVTITNDDGSLDDFSIVEDLATTTSISGRGVVFNEKGEIIASKGNIVFRDAEGNTLSLNSIKYRNIKEDALNNTYLRDQSLTDKTNGTKDFVSVNQILEASQESVLSPGNGNVIQVNQIQTINTDNVEILTVPLSEANQVFVKCKVIVDQDALVTLYDETIAEEPITLTSSKVTCSGDTPLYLTYSGNLPQIEDDIAYNTSYTAIYNNFYKRFFQSARQDGDTFQRNAPHNLVLRSDVPFSLGYMNIIVSDTKSSQQLKSGKVILNDTELFSLKFDDAYEDIEYTISSLDPSEPIGIWYSDKSTKGFTINLERKFTGTVYWETIR